MPSRADPSWCSYAADDFSSSSDTAPALPCRVVSFHQHHHHAKNSQQPFLTRGLHRDRPPMIMMTTPPPSPMGSRRHSSPAPWSVKPLLLEQQQLLQQQLQQQRKQQLQQSCTQPEPNQFLYESPPSSLGKSPSASAETSSTSSSSSSSPSTTSSAWTLARSSYLGYLLVLLGAACNIWYALRLGHEQRSVVLASTANLPTVQPPQPAVTAAAATTTLRNGIIPRSSNNNDNNQKMGDGCFHVFLHVGGQDSADNVSVLQQSRSILVEEEANDDSDPTDTACVFWFEPPNPQRHANMKKALSTLRGGDEKEAQDGHWRIHAIPFGVADEDFQNEDTSNELEKSTLLRSPQASRRLIRLATWIQQHVAGRQLPSSPNLGAQPKVILSMASSGGATTHDDNQRQSTATTALRVLPDLLYSGVYCQVLDVVLVAMQSSGGNSSGNLASPESRQQQQQQQGLTYVRTLTQSAEANPTCRTRFVEIQPHDNSSSSNQGGTLLSVDAVAGQGKDAIALADKPDGAPLHQGLQQNQVSLADEDALTVDEQDGKKETKQGWGDTRSTVQGTMSSLRKGATLTTRS